MTLPFELKKYHKSSKKADWKYCGMIFRDDGHFNYVYNKYIHATNCELCNKLFLNSKNRHLDHDHNTGEVRNIVCQKCNRHKKDNKSISNTGEKFIFKRKSKEYKTGYCFGIQIVRDEKNILNTKRKTLEEAIICRDEFLKNNPEIFS
jgi:hypothetical protein